MTELVRIEEELVRLRSALVERRRTLPAHTVRVHQMQEVEDLEERIAALERRKAMLPGS